MLPFRALHSSICASCRLRASIGAKQIARSRRQRIVRQTCRQLSSSRGLWQHGNQQGEDQGEQLPFEDQNDVLSPEEAAARARKIFGDSLPEGYLSEEQYRVYERLYGKPLEYRDEGQDLDEGLEELQEDEGMGTGVLKETQDGALEEVDFAVEEAMDGQEDDIVELDEVVIGESADSRLARDIRASMSEEAMEGMEQEEQEEQDEGESFQRAHPLTLANRFSTSPATLVLPNHSLVDAVEAQISQMSNKHLKEAAHRVFGGVALPYSTSTPVIGKIMQQKPIGLDAAQSKMSEMEGYVFLAALVPGIYASVMSVLVETRRRLGTVWAEDLVEKAGKNELRILDAGGGGAGVLAVREMLRAEWERMHEESGSFNTTTALAEADGKIGGASAYPPIGHATVLTGSDILRKRASRMLENTTFVPRLPDYLHAEEAKKKGRFNIIIAPHTLWPLREDYLRRTHLQNLWSMLSQDGGVLLLLEKGVSRGFELVAAARESLLESRIASPSPSRTAAEISDPIYWKDDPSPLDQQKEKGMIVAPCTNHKSCPMYQPQGLVKGRRDICHFSQRYTRPAFLQTLLGARDKNFEDVKFSYLSVMRGRGLREEKGVVQDEEATERAFQGYEHDIQGFEGTETQVHPLALPRAVLPPLKRRGHVILDLCTPSGTLERWTVPKSFSRQAFRDARKSSWGDLWALGAKTRVPRVPKIKKRKSDADLDVKGKSREDGFQWDKDEFEGIVGAPQVIEKGERQRQVEKVEMPAGQPAARGEGGRLRNGRKVKGIRDKRDKKGEGNGRRRNSHGDLE